MLYFNLNLMGFNTGGIVLKGDFEEISCELGINENNVIEKYLLDEAIFSTNCDKINIGTKGEFTLIINDNISFEDDKLLVLSEKFDILSFMVSDVTSSYYLGFFSNGEKTREYGVAEFEIEVDEGELLKGEGRTIEEREDNIGSESIFEIVENFSGISLYGDDLDSMKINVYSHFDIKNKKNENSLFSIILGFFKK